jgi:hypothetical protein
MYNLCRPPDDERIGLETFRGIYHRHHHVRKGGLGMLPVP